MPNRSGKFYRKNEAEVMESLGLKPTVNSGSGWVEKEDGQNDYLICQLKSTDANSIRINQKDIRVLEYNANVCHKIPMFAIQFLNTGEVWLMAKPIDFNAVAQYLDLGYIKEHKIESVVDIRPMEMPKVRTIRSSSDARNSYHTEQKDKYNKTKSAK